jgi:SAM-dependent methyltransferase
MRSRRVSLAAALLAAAVAVPAAIAQPFDLSTRSGPSRARSTDDTLRAASSAVERQAPPKKKPDVIYVPTPQPVVEAMLELAQVKRGDVVYDLGSGDGRIVIAAAKNYGASGVGVEIDRALVKQARENAAAAGVSDRVHFVTQDLFTADLSKATVVTLYLLQSINERLRPKLVRELKPGARIVSHVFNMGPEWPPEKTITVERSRVFLWSIPGR